MDSLNRQTTAETTKSDYSLGSSVGDKGYTQQREFAPQQSTIVEEDEDGNVGHAEFVKGLDGPEIVSPSTFGSRSSARC